MRTRAEIIANVLRHPQPVRPPLAYELRGSVVQLLGPGTTDPTWVATPEVLAQAIDTALTREREKDIPASSAGTPSTPGHTLVLQADCVDYVGACGCGRPIGRTPRARSLDGLVGLWEQHVEADSAWAEALASLPASATVIGAS